MAGMNIAEAAQRGRDLRGQIAELEGLTGGEQSEVIFISNAPGREPITIYSLADGEPITVPKYMVMGANGALAKRNRDGSYRFTARKEEVPEYKLGDVKCFLHPESVERQSGLLGAAGLEGFVCQSAHHPSRYAMEQVAKSKHHKQGETFQELRKEQREQRRDEQQQQQIDATLELARTAAPRRSPGRPPKEEE